MGLRAGGCIIVFAQINLRIRQSQIRLNHRDKVHLQGFLTPGLNPNVYATGATPDDPARRLGLQLTGENHGCNFQIWLTVGGDKNFDEGAHIGRHSRKVPHVMKLKNGQEGCFVLMSPRAVRRIQYTS